MLADEITADLRAIRADAIAKAISKNKKRNPHSPVKG